MEPHEHYDKAVRLLETADGMIRSGKPAQMRAGEVILATAQIHATLALYEAPSVVDVFHPRGRGL
jgi:hypothetical protein